MSSSNKPEQILQPSIISYIKSPPNICSLAGLACTLFAIYFSLLGVYYAAMIGMIWAVVFDWADGMIARRMKGRTAYDKTFGMQLDSLIDIVNYGVAPAILLLSLGKFEPIFLPGAFLIIAASAIRLSYFNTYGLSGESKYTGLALDNNNMVIVFVFLFESILSADLFLIFIYAMTLILAALNVSQIKTPKLSGNPRNVFLLAFYTLAMTGIYGWKLL